MDDEYNKIRYGMHNRSAAEKAMKRKEKNKRRKKDNAKG